jgi:hypothetical protein
MKHLSDFLRRLALLLMLISIGLGAAAQGPGGGNTGGPPGGNTGGGSTPGGPGNGGTTGGPPGPSTAVATIISFTPTSGPVGTVVTITGTNLTGATAVAFNGTNATTFAVVSGTQLTATVPTGASTGPISAVTPAGAATSTGVFTVTAASTAFGNVVSLNGSTDKISAPGLAFTGNNDFTLEALVRPNALPTAGFSIITSNGFDNGTTGNGVAFGIGSGAGGAGSNLVVLFSGLSFFDTGYTFPAANQWYHVAVTRRAGITYAYVDGVPAPLTTTTTPAATTATGPMAGHFAVGAQDGVRFFNGRVDEARAWSIGRTQADIQSTMQAELTGNEAGLAAYYDMNRTGQGAGLVVRNGAAATGPALNGVTMGTATTPVFTPVTPALAPTISSFTPTAGVVGTVVTITGTNLTGTTVVWFNGTPATFSGVSSTSLTATVPAGASTGPISLTTPYGTATSTTDFSLGATISSFTPTSGPAGTTVTVTGTNLSGATSVTFGGVAAGTITANTATGFTVTAPAGAPTGPICVVTPQGTACSATNFTFPLIIATGMVTPASLCAGSSISVPFTAGTASYGTGNVFQFQLSDASGVFDANGPLYGTLTASGATGGTLAGVVPQTTPGGTGYRVRVVASNPATVGSDNGTDITINPSPISQAAGPASVAYGSPINLTVTPAYPGATYAWSGPLGFSATVQSPTVASATNVGVNRYTVVVTLGNCSFSSFVDVTVQAATVPLLTLTPFAGPLCPAVVVPLTFNVTGVGFAAGNTITAELSDTGGAFGSPTAIGTAAFSGLGSGTISVTLPAGTAGTSGYRIRLVGNSPASTSNTNGSDLTVTAPPTVTLAAFAPVCASAGAFALTGGLPAGGTYRVGSAVATSFNPAVGVGSYTISYTVTSNGCSATATQTLEVTPLPTVTLAAQPLVCANAVAFALAGGLPAGGTYSGVGVSGGQFSAAVAGVGTRPITYTYTDGFGCVASATRPLTVLPTPTFATTATQVCAGQPATLTVSNAGPGATYLWSPGGETTASITVAPTVATTYAVTVTNAAGCPYSFSQNVVLNPAGTPPGLVGQLQPVDGSFGLSLPITFSWSPAPAAASYDVYVWPAASPQPATPVASGIVSLQYTYSGSLPYGASYQWRVVARNACFGTPGPIQTFSLRELPDLRVSFIQNPDTVYAGQTMQMAWNVTNTGPGSTLAQQWNDYVWLSQDSVFNAATAVQVGAWGNTTFLQPNATYITNATFRVPYSQAGYYYVFVRANSNQFAGNSQLLETTYANNLRRATKRTLMIVPQTPDFSVENFVSPPDPSVGYTDVTMRYRVYNRGLVAATQERYDEFFISPDTILNISQNTGRLALGPNAISLGRQRVRDTLLTNGFYARTVTVRVPHTEYGTRYFYAYTDTDNVVFETASTNNVNRPVAVQIILRPPPDLVPTQLRAPTSMLAGTSASISWDVRNQGNNAPVLEERYWADQFWLSPTPTFNPATAIPVGTLNIFGGDTLLAQHHYRRTVALNIPNGLSGTYYVFGMADYVANSARGNVFEYLSEGNNLLRSGVVNVTLTYADLQPTAFTGPATIDAFQSFTLNYTIRNNATAVGPATGTWTDAVYMVAPGGTSYSCALIGQATHTGPLAVGASYSGSLTLTVPRTYQPGSYDLVLVTNVGGTVYEYTFGNNNETRFGITYRYSDDLRLTALGTTGTALSGQTIGLNFSVDNQGAFRTLATGWQDQFWLSADATLDASDLQLTAVTRNSDLAVGASYNGTATVRLPHGLQGNFFIIGKVGVPDGRGYCNSNVASSVLVDTNPANNVRTTALPITLTPPCDLLPVTYTLPTNVVAGQQVTIPYTVTNQGVGATLEGNWDDGVYLSTSPSVNGSVVRIGTFRHVGTLAAGATYSGTITATIPGYLSGNYYVFLVADITPGANGYYPVQLWGGAVQYGTVYEHQQELNNVVQGNIIIQVPLPADLVVTSVTVPAARKLGQVTTVHYTVQNQGANAAVGQLKDGLYLSQDATVDGAVDQLFATRTANVTIAPNATVPGVVRSRLQGIQPGTYHGLMATNLFNDIYEGPVSSPAANNNVTDAANRLAIGVDDLPLRTPTSFPLMLDSVVYYRVTPTANKDMVLTLTSNQSFGQNEVYVAYNRPPTPADYDFIYLNQVSTAQEILVPTTGPLPYYVLVKTPYVYPGLQTATLYADTLGFQVRSITANRVGRGRVTTQVLGAGFRRLRTGPTGNPATRFYLTKGNSPAIRAEAQVLRFRNSTEVTLRWRLDTLSVGQYNVVADNAGTRVQLTDGLTVEPARPLNVDFATIIPQVVRIGTNANWTYFLQNNSNIDVPYWEFQYDLPPGQSPVITHTPNVRKKSDYHAGGGSATPRNRLDDGLTEVLPFIATDLRPGEIIQVNLRLTPNRLGGLPVVWNQAAMTEEWYTRQTLDHIARYRAAVLAAPANFPAGVATLAANANAWQDSLRSYYVRNGLLDTVALRLGRLRTGYTATSGSIAIPGGVCGDWGVTECVRPFRPNPFDADQYPAALVGCADSIVFTYKGRGVSCTQIVGSADPNLIVGPDGSGHRKMVGSQARLSYQVQYENDPNLATAPAQVVRINVPLSAKFDPQQFRLGSFGWASQTFQVPANSSTYSALLDMPDSLGYDVRVLGTVDVVGRRLIWQLETIDPATGVAPTDPNKGFLLLNDSTGRGQGFVNYTIKAAPSAVTGDTLAVQASIVFDTNPPIATNRWKNLLDAVAPTSQLAALPASTPATTVALNWTSQDDAGGSGLLSYDLYASQNGGPFQPVAQNLSVRTYNFAGVAGARYSFFVSAQDTTGNREPLKLVGDTFTVLGAGTPLPVDLTAFTAEKHGPAVALAWRTASELNSDRFEVERSRDARVFDRIGSMAAKGTTTVPSDYNFLDDKYPAEASVLYYRLRQMDRNGAARFSPVRAVQLGKQADMVLYPNPAHEAFTVAGVAAGAKLAVFDALGRQITTSTADASGTAHLTLPAGLAAGVYVVRVLGGNEASARRLVVQ